PTGGRCVLRTDIPDYRSYAAHERDVLLAIQFVRDRRAHAALQTGGHFEQLLALIGAIGEQPAVINHLKHDVPGGAQRSTTNGTAARHAPANLLRDWIPGDESAAAPRPRKRIRPNYQKLVLARRRHWFHQAVIRRPVGLAFISIL